MKKTAGAFLIIVFCIGMLAPCAGKENIDTTTSDTGEYLAEELDIDGMQLTMKGWSVLLRELRNLQEFI